MTPTIGKKLSFFVAVTTLLVVGVLVGISYRFIDAQFAQILRKDTLDAAALLSSRVRNEMRHAAEKGRILAAAALEEFRSSGDQIRFLEENLALDDQFISLSLFRRNEKADKNNEKAQWSPVFRLTRPEGDPTHLEEDDFKQLDLKYPMDLSLVSEGAVEVATGLLKDGTPILRLAVPIVKKKNGGFTQVLGIELRQERLTSAFAEATGHFSFVLDRRGRVVIETDPSHFTLGEDLTHLPILQMARSTEAPSGNLDYHELPGGILQYGSYQKIGYADLIVVTQAPRTHVIKVLRHYTREMGLLGLAFVCVAMALALVASWGIIGGRLARLGSVISKLGDGRYAANFPDLKASDEVSDFARHLQKLCDELKEREKMHGTFVKLRNRRYRVRIADGRIRLAGDRLSGTVASFHLAGLEEAAAKADPERILKVLNEFYQEVSDVIETNHGVVDRIDGKGLVAYWGIPVSDKGDLDRCLTSCLEVRKLGKELNDKLAKAHLPELALKMGVHWGSAIAGQVGPKERLEYTVMGEAIETAERIQTFTDQFGTDLLLTGAVASRAPKWYQMEKVSSGDDSGPELFELLGATDHAVADVSIDDEAPPAAEPPAPAAPVEQAAAPEPEPAPAPSATETEAPPAAAEAAPEPTAPKKKKKKKAKLAAVEGGEAPAPTAAADEAALADAEKAAEEAAGKLDEAA